MSDLDAHLSLTPLGPGHLQAQAPEGWQQGRGLFGGLVLALLTRAAATLAEPDRPLRSLTAVLCGPTQPGPADIFVEALRVGHGVTTVAARLVQAGEVQAHATVVFARTRASAAELKWCELAPPTPPPWREVPTIAPEGGPVFAQHIEFRPVRAPFFGGGAESGAEGWVRFKQPPSVRDGAFLAMLCDLWWPSVFARLPGPRPMATLAFTMQVVGDPGRIDPELPVYHRGRAPVCGDGYAIDMREIWSATGELLALNQQTFAVIR
ncbi:MAG TPA: thioesterase family protein [Nannocystis sp.]